MLHMTCDVIGITQYHILKSKMAAMYFAHLLKLFLVNLHLKTLKRALNDFSDINSVKYKEFE